MPYLYYKTYYDFLFILLIFIGIVTGFSCDGIRISAYEAKVLDR